MKIYSPLTKKPVHSITKGIITGNSNSPGGLHEVDDDKSATVKMEVLDDLFGSGKDYSITWLSLESSECQVGPQG